MEEAVKILGGCRLKGKIKIDGSKNAAVALIPAALLAKDVVVLDNVPHIDDVEALIDLLRCLNVEVIVDKNQLIIDSRCIKNIPLLKQQVQKIRASYYFMGVLIALFDQVIIAPPGGCQIGQRPIDLHKFGFNQLGIEIVDNDNCYQLRKKQLRGKRIILPKISVGATINLMLAACGANGETIIENGAKEPEVHEVAALINKMGGAITGVGTKYIKIIGNRPLGKAHHTIIADRIEAGSYLIFGAALADDLEIINVDPGHLQALLKVFNAIGIRYQVGKTAIRIFAGPINNAKIKTAPYPGFPTDLQQPITTLLLKADGISEVVETIYPDRVAHIKELIKLQANVKALGNKIIIQGPNQLIANRISAKDLRGGASLLLAAMMAKGETILTGIKFIKRGYGNFITKLNQCGARIELIEVEDE